MKVTIKHLIGTVITSVLLTGCVEEILDQQPQDFLSESTYFTKKTDFVNGVNYLHTCIYGWNGNTTYPINFDYGSDLNAIAGDEGSGNNTVIASDTYWNQSYAWLRTVNIFLSKVDAYSNPAEVDGQTGQALFFRAWHHFFLMKRYGGVPIATVVPTEKSDIVWGPRSSRYQVMDQILADLDSSIAKLGRANITKASTSNDGHVTQEAAKAFKARVCLFEGTWEKYNGTTTDGDGTTNGVGSVGWDAVKYTRYLTMAKELAKEVINDAAFSLWKGLDTVNIGSVATKGNYSHMSNFYLFNLEDAASNPNGLTKASNNEAIFRSVYDFTYRQGGTNLSHTKAAGVTRKLMDMFLCSDGLPVQYSSVFKGYAAMTSEFDNRDYRLVGLVYKPMNWYWGYGKYNTGAQYTKDITTLASATYRNIPALTGGGGYGGRKFASENNARTDNQESADYMHIRLAEVYLIYAEATCELNGGTITNADLDYSLNKVRARAGVANLSNELIAPYPDLTVLGEIRRERALELHGEGHRISDLCRWGKADEELAGKPSCGVYLKYGGVETEYSTATNPNTNKLILTASAYPTSNITSEEVTYDYPGIVSTKIGAIVTEQASNRKFALKNYIQPIPTGQIDLNPNLLQNPGW